MDNPVGNPKITNPAVTKTGLMHKLSLTKSKGNLKMLVGAIVVVLLGTYTGWALSGSASSGSGQTVVPGSKVADKEAGISDESTFSDTATGTLEEGGIEGVGTHTLKQNDDPSKDVALTSTIIDLDSYVGRKIQVWGQTLSAQQVSWLMDVGKLRVLD